LQEAVAAMFQEDFDGRVLPFDGAAAYDYAIIVAHRRQAGKPISQFDAQTAAIARSRGAVVATRNVSDFEDCGIDVHNPFAAPPE
jgi:predicted nucleic acid-binding protein